MPLALQRNHQTNWSGGTRLCRKFSTSVILPHHFGKKLCCHSGGIGQNVVFSEKGGSDIRSEETLSLQLFCA